MIIPLHDNDLPITMTPEEESYVFSLIGTKIWVREMRGFRPSPLLTRLIKRLLRFPVLPQEGDVLETFCLYFRSQETGEERWNSSLRHYKVGWGDDLAGRTWVIGPQTRLPGHWAGLADSHWVFLARL